HGVVFDGVNESFFFLSVRQLSVQQQVAGFEVIRFLGQLLDRVAAVQQNAGSTINIGDLGFGGGSGHKAGIVGEQTLAREAANVDNIGPYCAFVDRQF